MPSMGPDRRRRRGYALVFAVIMTGAIAAVAVTVASVTLVESRAAAQNINSVRAYSLAFSGLQRAMAAINRTQTAVIVAMDGRDIEAGTFDVFHPNILDDNAPAVCLKLDGKIATPAGSDPYCADDLPVFNNWNQTDPDNPGGTGGSYSFGLGGYRIFLMQDYAEPIEDPNNPTADQRDDNRYVLIRVYGWWGDNELKAEAMIESTYMAVVPPTE